MEILVILLLILLNGLFAMSEIALISARRSNLEMQARQGSAGARQALKLAKDPDRFLSTVQIGITLIGILTGIYSGDTLAAKFGKDLAQLGIPLRAATITAQVTIVIVVTYLTIIFGELVPKRIGMNAAEVRAVVARAPHNRYPVADGSLDKLLGVVYLKDLFLHLDEPGFDLRSQLTPAKFFHEGFEVYNALEQLRSEQLGYGIICDEFGVTRGIITLKDIFEALVGELPDPREEPDIVRREDGSCLVDGQCPYYDFLAWFGLEEVFAHNAYNTVSGLILEQLAHIPATGEKLSWNGFTFEIVDMDGARIDKVLVTFDQQEQL